MSSQKTFRCVTDETALVANISEIKKWISQGILTLIIPVYTLERLHTLKRDASQIGINAREAVKFLDRVTSGKDNVSENSIVLQGPMDQYATWQDVEAHLKESGPAQVEDDNDVTPTEPTSKQEEKSGNSNASNGLPGGTNELSQILLNKLNFAKEPEDESAMSTPPTSPSSSNAQSSKTSPEVTSATPAKTNNIEDVQDDSDPIIVPHTSRPLINSAVFLLNKEAAESTPLSEALMLTNDLDTAMIARRFGLNVKSIHQLRSAISAETLEAKNQTRYVRKNSPKPSSAEPVTKTLFSYEDDDEEEEVVFRPRGGRSAPFSRGRSGAAAVKADRRRSAEVSNISTPSPDIPTQEIDPDSFDRGAFGRPRPSTNQASPLVNGHNKQFAGRGNGRGNFGPSPISRGASRGNFRGSDRGSTRGRGKLFVP